MAGRPHQATYTDSTGPDPKGHYAALGVPTHASPERIKLAFRRKAMELHPDRNPEGGTTDAFQRANEAYRVLSDAEARARYDAEGQGAGQGRGASRRAAASPGERTAKAGTADGASVCCSRCGVLTAQPRLVGFHRVIGLIVIARRTVIQGVFCRACADVVALRASLTTVLLGWWAVPKGPLLTVKALWCNMLGGERPRDANAALLRQLTLHFIATGNALLARAALDQALRLVDKPEMRQKIQKLRVVVGDSDRDPKLIDRWSPTATRCFWFHAGPMLAVAALVVLTLGGLVNGAAGAIGRLLPGGGAGGGVAAASAASVRWHAADGPLMVRAGPGSDHAPVGRLNRMDAVELLGRADGWVRIRTPGGQIGFVAADALARD